MALRRNDDVTQTLSYTNPDPSLATSPPTITIIVPMVATHTKRMVRQCCLRIWCLFFVLAILFASAIVYAVDDDAGSNGASAEEETNPANSDASSADIPDAPPKEKIETPKSKPYTTTTENEEEEDWGSFYDPNKVFCGEFDCYKILGFDHETWGSSPPSLKDITKSYRGLSRKWHPDKNKAKGAREKFVVSSTMI